MTEPITTPCPKCGEPATGSYCDQCGTSIGPRFCGGCGAATVPGARFCAVCGAPTTAATGGQAPRPPEPRGPWWVAAGLSVLAIALVLWAAGQRGDGQAPQVTAATAAPAVPPDLSTMTPREQFTRLNDRIMAAAQSGDSATVLQFWPMAAQAYRNLLPGDLDVDVRYHMATLHLLVGELPAALALTDTIMTESPDNLLAWYLRGEVAGFQGDTAAGRRAREAFLANYDAGIGTGRQEYLDHADLLADYRIRATSR